VGLRYFSCVVTFALLGTLFRLLVVWLECRKILTTLDTFLYGALRGTPFLRGIRFGGWEVVGGWNCLGWSPVSWKRWNNSGASGAREEQRKCRSSAGRYRKNHQARNDLRSEFAKDKRRSDSQHKPAASRPDRSDDFVAKSQPLQEWIAKTCAEALKYLQPKWWGEEGLIVARGWLEGCDEEKNITVVWWQRQKDDEEEKEPSLSTRLAERFRRPGLPQFILVVLLAHAYSGNRRRRPLCFSVCSRSTLIHSSPEQHCAPQPSCCCCSL